MQDEGRSYTAGATHETLLDTLQRSVDIGCSSIPWVPSLCEDSMVGSTRGTELRDDVADGQVSRGIDTTFRLIETVMHIETVIETLPP